MQWEPFGDVLTQLFQFHRDVSAAHTHLTAAQLWRLKTVVQGIADELELWEKEADRRSP